MQDTDCAVYFLGCKPYAYSDHFLTHLTTDDELTQLDEYFRTCDSGCDHLEQLMKTTQVKCVSYKCQIE